MYVSASQLGGVFLNLMSIVAEEWKFFADTCRCIRLPLPGFLLYTQHCCNYKS